MAARSQVLRSALVFLKTRSHENPSPAGYVRLWYQTVGSLSSKKLWQLLITFELKSSSLANKVIVIDPGHGGTDPGAISPNGLRESGSSI